MMNQNTNPTMLIGGKIGNKVIAKEDLATFMSSIKDFEWTDNNLYKHAKVVEVKPTFAPTNQYEKSENYQPKNINFDSFYIEENSRLENFQQYKMEIENRRVQCQDKILQKKKEFVENFLPKEGDFTESSEKKDILEYIKNNKAKIITNSALNGKLGKYVVYLNPQQKNVGGNFNFDFKR